MDSNRHHIINPLNSDPTEIKEHLFLVGFLLTSSLQEHLLKKLPHHKVLVFIDFHFEIRSGRASPPGLDRKLASPRQKLHEVVPLKFVAVADGKDCVFF